MVSNKFKISSNPIDWEGFSAFTMDICLGSSLIAGINGYDGKHLGSKEKLEIANIEKCQNEVGRNN